MKKCLFCTTEVDDGVKICPDCHSVKFDKSLDDTYCDYNINYATAFYSEYAFVNKKAKKKKSLIILSTLSVAFIIGIILYNLPCSHEYKKTVVSEADYVLDGKIEYVCEKCDHKYSKVIPKMEAPVQVTVLDKHNHQEEVESRNIYTLDGNPISVYQPPKKSITFDIELKNLTDKDISKIKGTLVVSTKTKDVNLDFEFDEKLAANSTLMTTNYGVNPILDYLPGYDVDKMAIFTSAPSELTYKFNLEEVTYAN